MKKKKKRIENERSLDLQNISFVPFRLMENKEIINIFRLIIHFLFVATITICEVKNSLNKTRIHIPRF